MPDVKFLLLCCGLGLGVVSCTTLSNRRDLYQPSHDAGPYNSLQQKKSTTPGGNPAREETLPSPQ